MFTNDSQHLLLLEWIVYFMLELIRNKKSVLYAVITVGIDIFFVKVFWGGFSFLTNDDSWIQATLNGTITGGRYPYHQFINSYFGMFLCYINRFIPTNRLWFYCLLICSAVGLIMLHYSILEKSNNKYQGLFFILMEACLYEVYCLSSLSFTLSPILLSVGAISLLFIDEPNNNISYKKIIFVSVIVFIASLIRYQSILPILPFYTVCLYRYLYDNDASKKSKNQINIKFCLLSLILIIVIYGANVFSDITQNKLGDGTFGEFNSYRVAFMDYPHPNYDEAPDLYKKNGWNESTYELINAGCFLPEEFSIDSLKGICSNSEENSNGLFEDVFGNIINRITYVRIATREFFSITALTYYNTIKIATLFVFLLIVVVVIKTIREKELKHFRIFIIMIGICSIIMILYLISGQRTVMRAFLCIFIPMMNFSLLSYEELMSKEPFNNDDYDINGWFNNVVTIILFLILTIGIHSYALASGEQNNFRKANKWEPYYDYIVDHPDSVFVYSDVYAIPINIDLFLPNNAFFWGGSGVGSDLSKKQLRENGFLKFTIENLNDDNVYFIGTGYEEHDVLKILKYLEEKGIIAKCSIIDNIGEAGVVYKFSWD